MKNTTRILAILAASAGAFACASQAGAAGLLGQRYAGATFDYQFIDDTIDVGEGLAAIDLDDPMGLSLSYNQPLAKSLDLGVQYSFLTSGAGYSGESLTVDADATLHQVFAGVTWFSDQNPKMKPFVTGAVGWMMMDLDVSWREEGEGTYFGNESSSDDEFVWVVRAGVEFPIGDKFAVAPMVEYLDGFDSDMEDTFSYGAYAEYELGKWSVVAKIMIDDDSNTMVSAGVTFGF
jgi:hypothetical protein